MNHSIIAARGTFLVLSFLAMWTAFTAAAEPLITEIMPANTRSLVDEDGAFVDWVEIYNPGPGAASLGGYYLTDDPQWLTKWAFPAHTLPADGRVVVFASGKNRTSDPAHLHTTFQLDAAGGFIALVRPDGTTIVSALNYPQVKDDLAYGRAENRVYVPLLDSSAPQILVPAAAADLAPDWNTQGFTPGAQWFPGYAPAAMGFDTNRSTSTPVNLARGGTAVQSTTAGNSTANLAIDGSSANYTATLNTDNAPFLEVTLAAEAAIQRVVLRNRTSCCGSRLRDITVEILAQGGAFTNFTSALLNAENGTNIYPNGPTFLDLNLTNLTGGPVFGRTVRVRRTPDPDLSGSGGQGTVDEAYVLSLAEVEVHGVVGSSGTSVNLARTGTPAPVASQSTTLSSTYSANLAIDGLNNTFTHTTSADGNPTWTLNLGRSALITAISLHNRESCCGSRLRDITISVLDSANNPVYVSPLLNPENTGYTYPNGPADLLLDLAANAVVGQIIQVRRTPDPDLSGAGGQGNADEASVLALGEVTVMGMDMNGYGAYIRTDVQSRMLNRIASAFMRVPFQVEDPAFFNSLALRVRYDDGFIAYLNGVKVAERNAPSAPAWDSAATADRDILAGLTAETIEINTFQALLVPGLNVLSFQALNSSASDPNFLLQPELTATYLRFTTNVFLVNATPGGVNDTESYIDEVADTQFSVNRGFFESPFSLSITSSTPGAVIYYSFDCSEPGPGKGGLVYTGPLTITNSSVVRARAFRDGWKPTDVDTHTYLFLGDVTRQAANWPSTRVPPPYFPASWGNNTNDYGMDPNIVNKYTSAEWKEALTQVPTISLVTEMKNLFDPATGIYANALQHGIDWERPGSIELMDPTNAVPSRFQENCGLRIRGGYSRNPQFVKHSFRVFFRAEYGAAKLVYPMFENEGANEFDTFDLRTSQNYSWPRESDFNNGKQDTMVREVFCRETLGAMGQPYRRSRYYHLYVNGHYWGLYETDERPEAAYGATYFGGRSEDYDVVKCANHVGNFVTEMTDGNFGAWSNLWTMTRSLATNAANANYYAILGCNPDGTRNPTLPVMLDVDNLIDYMLGIFYSGDGDATLSAFLSDNRPNNWFGMKNRNDPNQGFRFFNSDCEHTLGAPSWRVDRTGPFGGVAGSNIGNFTYSNPQYMHEDLMRNLEYRLRFADHVQRHFFNNGALTPQQGTNRFLRKAAQITKAIRAYSARWGDAVRTPAYGEADWISAITNVVNGWFPSRTAVVLQQLKDDGLYPTTAAPVLSQHGGEVQPGYNLTLSNTNTAGVIFYTTDGSDPRLVGGTVAPGAVAYATPLPINGPIHVRARVLNGTNWSALVDAVLRPPQDLRSLVISEMMYNPPGQDLVDGDEFEFLELKNTGTTALDLGGLRFSAGITYTFPAGTFLQPGQHYLLARNAAQFALRYPGVRVDGIYSGRLDNGGETLRLVYASGAELLSFTYDDAAFWPVTPDNFGFSLVLNQPGATMNLNDPKYWRASSLPGGSPGAEDAPSTIPAVVVSEVLSGAVPPAQDVIELYNGTLLPADLSGWYLTDNPGTPKKFRIPDGTIMPPGTYRVFVEQDFNPQPPTTNNFGLRIEGDQVFLFSGNTNGDLTGYSYGFSFDGAEPGVSFGREVVSSGESFWPAQVAPSLGTNNIGPRIGPLVLGEIQYHPAAGDDEFIEIKNITASAVQLFDPAQPTNTYRMNGLSYTFPTNIAMNAGELLLLVGTDPDAFRAKYAVPAQVRVLGPYAGNLQDSGERLQLQRPVTQSNDVYFVTVDEVRYNDRAPWPPAADGSGPSLQRTSLAGYGNEPTFWLAALPSPGRDFTAGTPPQITAQPTNQTMVAYQETVFSVTATGPEPLLYQWRFNGTPIAGATGNTLLLTNVQPHQAGAYTVVVFSEQGSTESVPALLTVLIPATLLEQPASQSLRPGSNAVFRVSASSTAPPITYQWQFNDIDLPDQTNATLTVSNVQPVNGGWYRAVVTDGIGWVKSAPAKLTVLVEPVIVRPPEHAIVTVGDSVQLRAGVTNTATLPVSYRWRRGSSYFSTNTTYAYEDTLVLTNVQLNHGTNYNLTAANEARPGGVAVSPHAYLVVVDPPKNLLVPNGATAAFNVAVGTRPMRITYQWLFNGNAIPDATNKTLEIPNVQEANYGTYGVSVTLITNTLTLGPVIYSASLGKVAADTDNDGMPDTWESAYACLNGGVADAGADPDGDAMSNLQEYLAGTDPCNRQSYLHVQTPSLGGAGSTNVILRFEAVSNKTYSVLFQSRLDSTNAWTRLQDVESAPTNRVVEVFDTSPAAASRFYRLVTPRQ